MDSDEAVYAESGFESFDTAPAPPHLLRVVRKEDESNGDNMRDGSPPRANDLAEAMHVMLLAQTSFTKTMEAQSVQQFNSTQALSRAMEMTVQQQAQSKTNGNGRWTGWIQTGVICGMLLVSGTNVFKTSEAALDGRITAANNVAQEAKRDASDAAKEAKKANINNAMLDTYNRELERALIRKGVALPSYPVLEK